MVIVKTISKFHELIKDLKLDDNLISWQNDMLENIVSKLTPIAKNNLLENPFVTIYVSSLKNCEKELYQSNIEKFKDPIYIYFLKILIDSKKEYRTSQNKIKILLIEYNKEIVETENIINSILYLVNLTDTKQSLSINTHKIDSLYGGEIKKFAKNVNKSIVTTLTGKRKNDKFIIFPKCKNEIIAIDKISKKYMDIGEKNINFNCPICSKKHSIDKNDLNKVILINKNNIVSFNCRHDETSFIGEKPFTINLNPYFNNINNDSNKEIIFSSTEKIMFFVNNFKHFTDKKR